MLKDQFLIQSMRLEEQVQANKVLSNEFQLFKSYVVQSKNTQSNQDMQLALLKE